jgi:hypothetical protein
VTQDIEAVLRKIEHWHQGSITTFKIMCPDATGFWHGIHWEGAAGLQKAAEQG